MALLLRNSGIFSGVVLVSVAPRLMAGCGSSNYRADSVIDPVGGAHNKCGLPASRDKFQIFEICVSKM